MITGLVTPQLEARINMFVEDANGQLHAIDATIDTGYTGHLTLPSTLIAMLGLSWLTDRSFKLADGTIIKTDVFSGAVVWDSQSRAIPIDTLEAEPVVGMKMLAGHELRVRVIAGGQVWIDAVP